MTDAIAPREALAAEIFTTTTIRRVDSYRLADALEDAPEFVVAAFRAMNSTGVYSPDEMIERIRALRMMAK